jgi:hypothetical protein
MSRRNRPEVKAARRAERSPRIVQGTTREPPPGPGWPQENVSVELTGSGEDECVEVVIHGVRHLLHSSTAAALTYMLTDRLRIWDAFNERHSPTPRGVLPLVEGDPEAWRLRGVTDMTADLAPRAASTRRMADDEPGGE